MLQKFSPPMINSASVSVVVSVMYEPSETWTGSLQCFWISSRRVQWCPVRRGPSPPPLSKLAWRRCAPMRRPEGSSRTHIAQWVPVFHFEVLPCLSVCTALQLHSCVFSPYRISSGPSTLVSAVVKWFYSQCAVIISALELALCVKMETSVQRSLARMEPCVQTAWGATTASANQASLGPTAKTVRSRCQHVLVYFSSGLCKCCSPLLSVSTVQMWRCAPCKRTRAAPSSVNPATLPTSVPAPVGGSSARPRTIRVSLQVSVFPGSWEGQTNLWEKYS